MNVCLQGEANNTEQEENNTEEETNEDAETPEREQPPPPPVPAGPSTFRIAINFISTFFTSLVPQQNDVFPGN